MSLGGKARAVSWAYQREGSPVAESSQQPANERIHLFAANCGPRTDPTWR